MKTRIEFTMPENCHECPIHDFKFNYCQLFDDNEDVIEVPDAGIDMDDYKSTHAKKRPSWCPLKSVDETSKEPIKSSKGISEK